MRQKVDEQFATILNKLHEGKHSEEDLLTNDKVSEVMDVTHLYATNARVTDYNTAVYNSSQNET